MRVRCINRRNQRGAFNNGRGDDQARIGAAYPARLRPVEVVSPKLQKLNLLKRQPPRLFVSPLDDALTCPWGVWNDFFPIDAQAATK